MSLPLAPPAGMRDLCPPESMARRALARHVSRQFEAHGYQLVTTPSFEHAEVLERGLESVDRRDLLRFVEPESGEVALLRPDITPQIARVIATRLHDRPPPYRLYYEGTIFRRRRGRARRDRQIAQAGIECVGLEGPAADAEVLAVAVAMAESLDLEFTVELKHPRVATDALAVLPASVRDAAHTAVLAKDRASLETLVRSAGLRGAPAELLIELPELYGDLDVLDRAKRLLGTESHGAIHDLERVAQSLRDRGVSVPLTVDLGEPRGHAYYTGVGFDLLAAGPGEPIGRGGRYDDLLQGFGEPRPATGFAVDLDNLAWARETAGINSENDLPAGVVARGLSSSTTTALRNAGVRVTDAPPGDLGVALAYATAWGFLGVVERGSDDTTLALIERMERPATPFKTATDLARFITSGEGSIVNAGSIV